MCYKRIQAISAGCRVLALVKDTFLQFPFGSPVVAVNISMRVF